MTVAEAFRLMDQRYADDLRTAETAMLMDGIDPDEIDGAIDAWQAMWSETRAQLLRDLRAFVSENRGR